MTPPSPHGTEPDDTRDLGTVAGFGREWSTYDQTERTEEDLRETFERYTSLVRWDDLPARATGLDLGCGSGRWARLASAHLDYIVAADASSEALGVAERALADLPAGCLAAASGALPIRDRSIDFAYSLGVLHHTLDPLAGLQDLVRTLKPSAPCLLYLYYALDDRPAWFRLVWKASDLMRRVLARAPFAVRRRTADAVALLVYWPLSRAARWRERRGQDVSNLPLSAYRIKPLYVLRTDALDRLGTRVEHRFRREEVERLMSSAGLVNIEIAAGEPYWCAIGTRPAKS